RRRRPADLGRADAGDRRHPGTPAETDPDLPEAGPLLVPAGDVASPPARQERPGPPADWEAAPGSAAWRGAGPVDGLSRVVECRPFARRWGYKSRAEPRYGLGLPIAAPRTGTGFPDPSERRRSD